MPEWCGLSVIARSHKARPAVPVAGVGGRHPEKRDDVRRERVERDQFVRRGTQRRAIPREERQPAEREVGELIRRVELQRTPDRRLRPLDRLRPRVVALPVLFRVGIGERRPGIRVVRRPLDRPLERGAQLAMLFGRHQREVGEGANDRFIRTQRLGRIGPHCHRHRAHQRAIDVGDRRDDLRRQLVLQIENRRAIQPAIVSVGPEMLTRCRTGQLRDDADHGAGDTDGSVQHESRLHALERRLSLHDAQIGEARQADRDVLGEAVGEIRCISAMAAGGERQHGDDERLAVETGRRVRHARVRAASDTRFELPLQLLQLVIDIAAVCTRSPTRFSRQW